MAKALDYVGLMPAPHKGPIALDEPEVRQEVSAFLAPAEIYRAAVVLGTQKGYMSWWKTLWQGVLAGIYLSFGGALVYFVGGQCPQLQETNPGLVSLLKGFFGLPFGLAMIVICGAELYTSNAAFLPVALFEGRITVMQLLKNWFWSFFGNLAGSLFMVWMIDSTYLAYPGGAAAKTPVMTSIMKTTEVWGACVARAFCCNYLVCLGVWIATAAQDISGKFVGILFPIGAFVAIGFDHVVANMFLIPFGMKLGSGVTVRNYIARSVIPVWLGNTIVAFFFVAGSYSFLYGTLPARLSNLLCGRGFQLTASDKRYDGDGDDDTAHNGGAARKKAANGGTHNPGNIV